MTLIKTKTIQINEDITDSITCDFCGKKFNNPETGCFEGDHFELYFGYGSRFDSEKWKFDICDDCAEKLKEKKLIQND